MYIGNGNTEKGKRNYTLVIVLPILFAILAMGYPAIVKTDNLLLYLLGLGITTLLSCISSISCFIILGKWMAEDGYFDKKENMDEIDE